KVDFLKVLGQRKEEEKEKRKEIGKKEEWKRGVCYKLYIVFVIETLLNFTKIIIVFTTFFSPLK
ncbi:24940_t:CDS:1, partial [Gigaspora margarita]